MPFKSPVSVVDPVPPLPTPSVPVSTFVPIDVVATTLPVVSVERSDEVRPENQVVPRVVREVELFCKLISEKVVELLKMF